MVRFPSTQRANKAERQGLDGSKGGRDEVGGRHARGVVAVSTFERRDAISEDKDSKRGVKVLIIRSDRTVRFIWDEPRESEGMLDCRPEGPGCGSSGSGWGLFCLGLAFPEY